MPIELDAINEAIQTAIKAAKVTSSIRDLVERLTGFFAKPQPDDIASAKPLIADLTNQIADAHMANAMLKEQLVKLQSQISHATSQKAELDRYKLQPTKTGDLVHALDKPTTSDEPHHYICTPCHDRGIKSVLQGDDRHKKCPNCGNLFSFRKTELIYKHTSRA